MCLQKDKEIAEWTERQRVKEEKIQRMRERVAVKAYHGVMSSDEDEDEPGDIPTVKLDMVEYDYIRAERDKYRLVVENWVQDFRAKNKRLPQESDTNAEIAVEMQDWEDAEKKYLDFKVKMLEAGLLEFSAEELMAETAEPKTTVNFQRNATIYMTKTMRNTMTGFGANK